MVNTHCETRVALNNKSILGGKGKRRGECGEGVQRRGTMIMYGVSWS